MADARARAIVDAPDRTVDDRSIDVRRRPAELLTFLEIMPGQRVGELIAGSGYTAELLGRAVAPTGVVFAENPRVVLETTEKPWQERLAHDGVRTLVRVDREVEDPFPENARDLDLVVSNLVYHDTVWLKVDRVKMNASVFASLRPGGRYVVIDHSAQSGRGLEDVQTLHRIDEESVRREVERAGFVLERRSSFLRNKDDKRDWNDSPTASADRRGTSDRFALMFKKPRK